MGTTLSPRIVPMFIRAGWQPDRSVVVPATNYCDAIVPPTARRIIREFHGLHVLPNSRAGLVWACKDVHFDLRAAMNEVDTCREWASRIGSRLFPIGVAGKGYMTLLGR